jgi:hypothetical protein
LRRLSAQHRPGPDAVTPLEFGTIERRISVVNHPSRNRTAHFGQDGDDAIGALAV